MTAPPSPSLAQKGSQLWLQLAVNHQPELLDRPLRASARLADNAALEWLSPVAAEGYVEYRDQLTFDRLGVKLGKRRLEDFWPIRGPVWDGLARASTGDVFLVEAKAHIGELLSGRSRASEKPLEQIRASLTAVRDRIAPGADTDWSGTFYQYANRLAHLHFLREENDVRAHLVFVYFLNAREMQGPSVKEEYEGATRLIEGYLGVRQSRISRYVHKVYVDVEELRASLPSTHALAAETTPVLHRPLSAS